MPFSSARCAQARFLSAVVLVALSPQVRAQPDARDVLIEQLRQRIEALEKKADERPAAPAPPAAAKPAAPAPSASEEAAATDEGARSLERALVREGGLVLPRKVIEVEPLLQYTYRGVQGLNIVSVAGIPQVLEQDLRRDEFEASVAVRAGLPERIAALVRHPGQHE